MTDGNALARSAVRRLRSGIVPDWELERLSVAYGSIQEEVEGGLAALQKGQARGPLFVRGEWGTGKTHLLTYMRTAASRASIASAWVDLNARSTALNYPQRFYPVMAETLKAGNDLGLKAILSEVLRDPVRRDVLKQRKDLHLLWWTIRRLLQDTEQSGFADLAGHWAWTYLLGGDISSMDYAYKRREAVSRFELLAVIMRAIGLGGLVLLFDEAETIDQLWNVRSRLSAYSVLGQLCQMQFVWCVFGVTERFDRTIQLDLSRDLQNWNITGENAKWFLQSWEKNRFASTVPPSLNSRSAKELARAVEDIYEAGYPDLAKGVADRCVDEWSRNPSRNPRRLIRLIIHRLDLARPLRIQPIV